MLNPEWINKMRTKTRGTRESHQFLYSHISKGAMVSVVLPMPMADCLLTKSFSKETRHRLNVLARISFHPSGRWRCRRNNWQLLTDNSMSCSHLHTWQEYTLKLCFFTQLKSFTHCFCWRDASLVLSRLGEKNIP